MVGERRSEGFMRGNLEVGYGGVVVKEGNEWSCQGEVAFKTTKLGKVDRREGVDVVRIVDHQAEFLKLGET